MEGDRSYDCPSVERREEIRVRKNGRKDKVIIERSAAEGLPEGWIKELVLTKKANKLRKDSFFFDPKSGYIFHSFKDASRYVLTGVIGNLARKPKENCQDEGDFENRKILSPSGSREERSPEITPEKEKNINIYVRNSKRKGTPSSDEHSDNCKRISKPNATSSLVLQEEVRKKEQTRNEQHVEKRVTMERELIPCNENYTATPNGQHVGKRVTRSQAKVKKNDDSHELGRKNPSSSNAKSENCSISSKPIGESSRTLDEGLGKREKAEDSTEGKFISCNGNGITNTTVKQAVERRVTRSQAKAMNDENSELKRKTEEITDSLPRRASKRLSGTDLEQTPELKTGTRVAREVPVVEQSDDCKEVLRGKPAPDCCKMTVVPVIQAVSKQHQECSSPKQNAAFSCWENREKPLVSEKNEQVMDKGAGGHSEEEPNVAHDSKNREMGSPRKPTREEAVTGKCEGTSKSIVPTDIYEQVSESPSMSMLSFQDVTTKPDEVTTCRRSGSFRQSKLNTVPLTWKKSEHSSSVDNNFASVAPTGNFTVVKGSCSALTEKNDNSVSEQLAFDANSVSEPFALDSTLADLWKDPCIAFAIKTLTGESFEPLNAAKVLTEPRKNNVVNDQDQQKGVTFFPVVPDSSNVSIQRPVGPTELTFSNIWKDPCIDFAIKTLTGVIPIGCGEPEGLSKSQLTTISTQAPEGNKSEGDRFHQQYNPRHKALSGGAGLPLTPTNLSFSSPFSKGHN